MFRSEIFLFVVCAQHCSLVYDCLFKADQEPHVLPIPFFCISDRIRTSYLPYLARKYCRRLKLTSSRSGMHGRSHFLNTASQGFSIAISLHLLCGAHYLLLVYYILDHNVEVEIMVCNLHGALVHSTTEFAIHMLGTP